MAPQKNGMTASTPAVANNAVFPGVDSSAPSSIEESSFVIRSEVSEDLLVEKIEPNKKFTTLDLVIKAIEVVGVPRKGASYIAIQKWIINNKENVVIGRLKANLKKAVIKALENEILKRAIVSKNATGLQGYFMLNKDTLNKQIQSKTSKKKTVAKKENKNMIERGSPSTEVINKPRKRNPERVNKSLSEDGDRKKISKVRAKILSEKTVTSKVVKGKATSVQASKAKIAPVPKAKNAPAPKTKNPPATNAKNPPAPNAKNARAPNAKNAPNAKTAPAPNAKNVPAPNAKNVPAPNAKNAPKTKNGPASKVKNALATKAKNSLDAKAKNAPVRKAKTVVDSTSESGSETDSTLEPKFETVSISERQSEVASTSEQNSEIASTSEHDSEIASTSEPKVATMSKLKAKAAPKSKPKTKATVAEEIPEEAEPISNKKNARAKAKGMAGEMVLKEPDMMEGKHVPEKLKKKVGLKQTKNNVPRPKKLYTSRMNPVPNMSRKDLSDTELTVKPINRKSLKSYSSDTEIDIVKKEKATKTAKSKSKIADTKKLATQVSEDGPSKPKATKKQKAKNAI